jgi:hypothetical protein
LAVNRHRREVNDYACGQNLSLRGLLAALRGAGVWRHALSDGTHYPCAARQAANNFFYRGICAFMFSTEIQKADRDRFFQMG